MPGKRIRFSFLSPTGDDECMNWLNGGEEQKESRRLKSRLLEDAD